MRLVLRLALPALACLALPVLAQPAVAEDKPKSPFDALIAHHAKANGVPESLVHRVILAESRYNPNAIGHGGVFGLMQIKPATARGVGYDGPALGLLDPETNLTYAVRYLAGALRAAEGNHDRAVAYYRSGYYRSKRKTMTANAATAGTGRPPLRLSTFGPEPAHEAKATVKQAKAPSQQGESKTVVRPASAKPATPKAPQEADASSVRRDGGSLRQ